MASANHPTLKAYQFVATSLEQHFPLELRVVDDAQVIALYCRSYDSAAPIGQLEHLHALIEQKNKSEHRLSSSQALIAGYKPRRPAVTSSSERYPAKPYYGIAF